MDRVNAVEQYYFTESYFFDIIAQLKTKVDILFAVEKTSQCIVAAAMMFKTKDIIQYHISGTKNEVLPLSPIRLLLDEMRIIGTQEGYKYFNLGGGLGNKEDSLFKFKSSFSKDFKPFKIWKYISNLNVYNQLAQAHTTAPEASTDFFPVYRQ
jgi:lipid II:glycine glycyltransferase (peptidoglycan interpeptide bridge formation enzyme)